MKQCSNCGKDFEPFYYQYQRRCEKCQTEKGYTTIKPKEKRCPTCNKKFFPSSNAQLFCSSSCMRKNNRGKNIVKIREYQKKWYRTHLDIRKQHRERHRDRINKKSSEWQKANPQKVKKYRHNTRIKFQYKKFLMFGRKCQLCGYNKNLSALELHHKFNNKKDKLETQRISIFKEPKNFILLCSNCHRAIHHPELNLKTIKIMASPFFEKEMITL